MKSKKQWHKIRKQNFLVATTTSSQPLGKQTRSESSGGVCCSFFRQKPRAVSLGTQKSFQFCEKRSRLNFIRFPIVVSFSVLFFFSFLLLNGVWERVWTSTEIWRNICDNLPLFSLFFLLFYSSVSWIPNCKSVKTLTTWNIFTLAHAAVPRRKNTSSLLLRLLLR